MINEAEKLNKIYSEYLKVYQDLDKNNLPPSIHYENYRKLIEIENELISNSEEINKNIDYFFNNIKETKKEYLDVLTNKQWGGCN